MANYASHLVTATQREPLFDRKQIKNDAGGYVFKVEPFQVLQRFLILGCDGGTYYTGEAQMTRRMAKVLQECARRSVESTITTILQALPRAIKPTPAVFCLAYLSSGKCGPQAARAALAEVNTVCRTASHLFTFVEQTTKFRGWGRGLRKAVAGWYTAKDPQSLMYQVTKYGQREGYTHRDLLRLAHPYSPELNEVFRYICSGEYTKNDTLGSWLSVINSLSEATSAKSVAKHIRAWRLVREVIPTKWLNSSLVWEALLDRMPYTALVRNLGKMTAVGLLTPFSDASKLVCERLRSAGQALHPAALLLASTTYQKGQGVRGNLSWNPDQNICEALEDAFYGAFDTVTPAGKNFMLAIDVSGSMGWRGFDFLGSIAGTHLKAYQAAAVMALAQTRSEPWCLTTAFTGRQGNRRAGGLKLVENFGRHCRLQPALDELRRIPVGPTDCALPMIYARENKLPVDTFVVYTDNESWQGKTHPCRALEDYRQATGRDAKLVVCALTATEYSVADPDDPGMLDVVGFDPTCPSVISRFAGEL